MIWWLWILLGLGLLALEMAMPGGFFALFFGVGALLVGALVSVGAAGPAWMQWLLFSVLSIGALATLRKPLQARLNLKGSRRPVDSLVGEMAVALEDFEPGGLGKVELRGTSWSARNRGSVTLGKGRRCVVEKVDGLTLWVRPE
jgi:membrane protein implicated in regulation of membrane protease activity